MRILHAVTRSDSIGGAQIHVANLCEALIEQGHETLVLAGGKGPFQDELDRRRIPFQAVPSLVRPIHPLKDARALLDLVRILREWQPDVAALHTAKAGLVGRIACRLTGIPSVFTPHGFPVVDRFGKRKAVVFEWVERLAGRFSDSVVAVCDYEVDLACRHKLVAEERLARVYNGIPDVDPEFQANPRLEPPRILMVGRMERPKDHGTLLRALAGLKDLPWRAELAGDGPLEPETRRLACELGIESRVQFLGFERDPRPLYQRAQIFVLSSRFEAFPYTLLEAMRAGLPVIASRLGGMPEAIGEGKTGFLAPAGDSDAWRTRLRRLITEPALRVAMGRAGRERYLREFTFEQMLARTLHLYQSVLRAPEGAWQAPELETGEATSRATIEQ